MVQQQVDLEVVHFILNQFSEDLANDCCKIIAKLVKSLSATSVLHESKFFDEKMSGSVSLLLNLLEYINPSSGDTELELPVNVLIENLKYTFQCSYENCNLPKNNVQQNILSIVSLLLKNKLIQKSLKSIKELAEFYNYTLTCTGITIVKKECKTDCLLFKLKVMTILYEGMANTTLKPIMVDFIELNYHLKECELLADLALHEDDKISYEALLHLIPAQIKFHKSAKVVKVIWRQISASLICDIRDSRVLTILCQVFDLCFDKFVINDKECLILMLFEDANYWKLIQLSLKGRDLLKRKQGLYLFKKSLHILNTGTETILCGKDSNIFYWDPNCKDELFKIYTEIIVILEFLDEQQIHIIKPIFKLVNTVITNILYSKKVNFSWILVVYEKMLLHESLQVVKLGLNNFLQLPEEFFLDEHIAKETAEMLAVLLNNLTLYYNQGLTICKDLNAFFKKVTELRTCKVFFCLFIKKICSQIWSAEALFFVIHSLSGIEKCSLWGKEEISEITSFVLNAFKTHNKIIRAGVQTELLNILLNLTDKDDMTLENTILLMSVLFERRILTLGSENWHKLSCCLKSSYSKQDIINILGKNKLKKLKNEPKYMPFILIFFFYAYEKDVLEAHSQHFSPEINICDFVLKYFQEILLSFKDVEKRPYCDKIKQDENLLIIFHIYKAHLIYRLEMFIEPTLPFLKDVILYIKTQLSDISDLKDFNEWELYLNAFETIIKTLFKYDIDFMSHLYMEIIKDLELSLQSNSNMCSIGIFWKFKFLNILLKLPTLKGKPSFLDSYLLKAVNEPLKKDNNYLDKTRDLLTLWGKMNSEFLECKWRILEYLIDKKLVLHGCVKVEDACWISNDDLVELCIKALDEGGYGILCPVMSVLKNLLPVMKNNEEISKIINAVWKSIMERKKIEEFKVLVEQFFKMVFQKPLIDKGESAREILLLYADLIFSESSLAVVNIFMKHVQQIEQIIESGSLFCHIIGKGLIFGSVEKRSERLTVEVCHHIECLNIFFPQKVFDYNTSNEIRARAVQLVLQLDQKSPAHQAIARQLIDTLLKMESEINKNRTRHFGNSYAHRIKHRLMQALLLLEPMLSTNEDQAIKLSKWVIDCLLSDNSQRSVRHMQEWLLIRILIRHSEAYIHASISNYYSDSQGKKKKSLYSLIKVIYHTCLLIRSDLAEARIHGELLAILSFCFHQHLELRLLAQVAFTKLYQFAKLKKFNKVTEKFEDVFEVFRNELELEYEKKKNSFEQKYLVFYFECFHPLNNYSLKSIYKDLPRLTNVDSDEWISVKMFRHCGVFSKNVNIPLKDSSYSLKSFDYNDLILKRFESYAPSEFDYLESEKFLDNYQKKIIPRKHLMPGWDEDNASRNVINKDGLIVVASLIDRIPNLGGLVRTCEVFGASEYIINSLRYTEDKQFTSLSVTAEKWIVVKEVKIYDLFDYLSEIKQGGYTIIGAEQALHSRPLSSVKFPKKSLILLGNEKEGIPPNLLPLLDVCVEIPQLGLIRSLNVHVTGALFIWEYAKQHHFS